MADPSKPGSPGPTNPNNQASVVNLPFGATPEALVNLVRERRMHAMNRYNTYFRKVSRWYDYYRGIYSGKFAAFRNNIHLPFLFSVVQSDVARKVQTSFGGWPIVEFTGYGHEDSWKARKNEALISAQMKDCGSFRKAVDFYTCSDLYGTAIARVGWKTERRLMKARVSQVGMDGRTIVREAPAQTVTMFDGPDWDNVDVLDFLIEPGKRSIADARWVIHRWYIDLDELKELADQGMYDKAAVNKIQANGTMPSGAENDYSQRVNIYRSYSEYDARRTERYAKPVEIWEMWGRVPSEFAPDGVVHRVVSVANGTTLLRNRPNPFWHGQIPFLSYSPMPDPHYFHGPGKMEIAEKMQFSANRFANQKMDALDITIDPMWLVNSSLGIDTENLFSRAGRVIKVDGSIGEDSIRPLSPDLRGINTAYEEIQFLWNAIQQATGIIEDTVQGAPASRRQTKAEFQGRQENVLTRLMLEARLAEENFVEPLANMMVALNKQFLDVPHEVKILGNDAIVNPITGFPLPQEPITIDNMEDVNHDYRARAVGSTQMLGKQMQQNQLMTLMQVMGGNPVGMQMVNWTAFFRQVFDAFQLRNVDELLNPSPTQLNMMAAQQGQGGGGQQEQGPDIEQQIQQASDKVGYGDVPPELMQSIMSQAQGVAQ